MRLLTRALVLAASSLAAVTPAMAASRLILPSVRPQTRPPATTPPQRPGTTPAPRPTTPPRPPQPRGFVAIGAMAQPEKTSFTDAHSEPLYRETATWSADHSLDGMVGVDAGAFARVWRQLGVGLMLTSGSRRGSAAVEVSLPHPFFFGQPRTGRFDVADVGRTEGALHVSAAYLVPTTGHLRISLFGGPSLFVVEQKAIEDVQPNEVYPYDAVNVDTTGISKVSENFVGVHAGVDLTWYATSRIGVGVLARYTTGSKSVSFNGGDNIDLKAGGVQIGLGLRIKF